MKPYPRIRKTIKWGGAAVTVLLVILWVGSGWLSVRWSTASSVCVVSAGRVYVAVACQPDNPRTIEAGISKGAPEFEWGFGPYNIGSGWQVVVPLWPLIIVGLLATARAWDLDVLARRRARIGLCPKCRYNRTGLAASAVCPECGAPSPPAPRVS